MANQHDTIQKKIAALLETLRLRAYSKGNTYIPEDRVSNQASPTPVTPISNVNSELGSQSEIKGSVAREEALRSKLNLTPSKKKLIPMKYSCEEIHERLTNGLCIFCDEQDIPGHQLKHKRLRVVMMDVEDASTADDEEKESLSNPFIGSQFQDANMTQPQELIQDTKRYQPLP